MNDYRTFSTRFSCALSDPVITDQDQIPLNCLQPGKGLSISTTITFSDEVNNELAKLLMASGVDVRVSFYAKPYHSDREIDLGNVLVSTSAEVFTYEIVLNVADSTIATLSTDESYQISAIARVGTAPFCIPSFMRVYIDGPQLLGNSSKAETEMEPEQKSESETTNPPRATRRRTPVIEKNPKK